MKFAVYACLLICPVAIAGGTFWECMFNFMPQWIPAGADIDAMQALDGSYSVGVSGFKKGKFAAKIVNVFIEGLTANGITGDFSGSRSGFIQFAWLWNTEIKIHLHDYNNWAALNAVIGAHVFTGGATAMAKALYLAREEFNDNSTLWRNKRVMLITDGYETEGGNPLLQAYLLKRMPRTEICIICVGNQHNITQYYQMATVYGLEPCVCCTEDWNTLKRGMIKAAKKLKPVIKQRRKNRRKLLKQLNSTDTNQLENMTQNVTNSTFN